MSQATHLPWYPKTHTTLTHGHFFFIMIILCAVNVEIQRFSDIGLTINHLTVSGMSLNEVMKFGRSDDKRPYLSSSVIKIRPFRNRQCHLSINARLHYNSTLEHLNILNGSVCVFFKFYTQNFITALVSTSLVDIIFTSKEARFTIAIFYVTRKSALRGTYTPGW